MAKYDVGIHAPYTWDEATNMACSLGDLAKRLGLSVSYLSSQKHDQGVSPRWDSEVRSFRKHSFGQWVLDCNAIVWFDFQKNKLQESISHLNQNFLVPLWHRTRNTDLRYMPLFNNIVTPSSAVHLRFQATDLEEKLRLAAWDTGTRLTRRPVGLVRKGEIRLFVSLDGLTVRKLGSELFSTFQVLLSALPHLHITIAYTRQWSKAALIHSQAVVKAARGRVSLLRKPNHDQWRASLLQHDWMFCPSVSPNSGCDALEALACGVPVISLDVPPYSEFIQRGYNGAVIRCPLEKSWLGAGTAAVRTVDLLEALRSLLEDQEYLFKLQQTNWPELESRAKAFQQVWRQLWNC